MLPDFFLEVFKACFPELSSELKQSILQISVDSVHHMKVIILNKNAREDLVNGFGEGAPKVKDNGPRLHTKVLKHLGEFHYLSTALKKTCVSSYVLKSEANKS